jgi:hypothetical protein
MEARNDNPGVAAYMTDTNEKLLYNAVEKSAHDPAFFCRFFLREWFPTPMPPFHLGMLALKTRKVAFLDDYPDSHEFLLNEFKYLADPGDPESAELNVFLLDTEGHMMMVSGPNTAEIIPRGFSKTTIENAGNLYELLTDGTIFCVYISESQDHAERQLGNIKRQLETNELLRAAYGNVVPTRSDSEKWGASEIQLKNGGILLARGRGSQIRGLNYNARRPNRITLDDVEDKESVATAQQRTKVSDWFYGDVVPAGNEMEQDVVFDGGTPQQELQITVLGTLLHAESLLITLQRDITFNHIRFGARLDDDRMLWPQKMAEKAYTFKKERFRRNGKLAEFAREYDSTIRVEEDALFAFKDITLYQPTKIEDLVVRAMACDPAISDQPGRDHTAISVGGRKENGMLWVLDVWGGLGVTPSELIDKYFEWQFDFKTHLNGIETQQYQKALVYLMREEMARRQRFFNIIPIFQGPDKSKDDRIGGILQPRYANGYVRHSKPLPLLENQLMDFPNGKKDYADATAMMFALLGETQALAAPDGLIGQDEFDPLPPMIPSPYSPGNLQIFTPKPGLGRGRYG